MEQHSKYLTILSIQANPQKLNNKDYDKVFFLNGLVICKISRLLP